MPTKEKKPLFSWREAVLESDLSSTTKHVLLTIACHMNDFGESCYPSMETLARQSSLSKRAVVEHIEIAKKEGWIEVTTHGFSGRGWRRNDYKSSLPVDGGGALGSPPNLGEAVTLTPGGGYPGDNGVVNQGNSSTSVSTSESTSVTPLPPKGGTPIPENLKEQTQPPDDHLHLEMSFVPFMERTWRESAHRKDGWKLTKDEKARLENAATIRGEYTVRKKWLEWLESGDGNISGFVRAWGLNGGNGTGFKKAVAQPVERQLRTQRQTSYQERQAASEAYQKQLDRELEEECNKIHAENEARRAKHGIRRVL